MHYDGQRRVIDETARSCSNFCRADAKIEGYWIGTFCFRPGSWRMHLLPLDETQCSSTHKQLRMH